jgi:tetratricopeptide (TPR) repeat protein
MQPRTGSSSTRRRLTILLLLFVGLILVLWISGALMQLGHMAVRQALDAGDDNLAESRLAYSTWVGASKETTFLQARLARHRGDYGEMSRLLDVASRAHYDARLLQREAMLARAQIGQFDDDMESKINAWILEGGSDTREICAAYANGLAASSRFEEATRILEAWSADYPSDPRPNFRLGRILEHQRRKEDALEQYRVASTKDPHYIPAIYSYGRLLFDQRKVDEALAVFEACPNADSLIPVQVSIAVCKKTQSKLSEAKQILQRVLKTPVDTIRQSYRQLQEPVERFVAAAELGKIESDEGNFEEAKKWLEKAIAFNSRDMEARYSYAVALRGLGEKEQSDKEFDYVKRTRDALASVNVYWDRVQSNPRDTEARLKLAKTFLEHESVRNGLYWLKSIQAYEPENAEVAALLEQYADEAAADQATMNQAAPDQTAIDRAINQQASPAESSASPASSSAVPPFESNGSSEPKPTSTEQSRSTSGSAS